MAVYQDSTPCDWSPDALLDCEEQDRCEGSVWNFSRVYSGLPPLTRYIVQIDGYDFTGDDRGTIMVTYPPCDIILPVNMLSFTGHNEGPVNILDWEISSSSDPDYFEIERSIDGINFNYLGSKPGADFATAGSAVTSYTFTDHKPAEGTNYYRLRTFDASGGVSYSEVVEITMPIRENGITSIYPNPARDQINADLYLLQSGTYVFTMVDVLGHVVYEKQMTLDAGTQTLTFDVSPFSNGIYMLNLTNLKDASVVYRKICEAIASTSNKKRGVLMCPFFHAIQFVLILH